MNAPTSPRAPLERATPEVLTSLATDIGSTPMQVGAVLLLDGPTGFDVQKGADVIAQRIHSVSRLRQRLLPVPFGCGRPVWVDDPDFDIARHVHLVKSDPVDRASRSDSAPAARRHGGASLRPALPSVAILA